MTSLTTTLYRPRAVNSIAAKTAAHTKTTADILVDMGRLHPADLAQALQAQKRSDVPVERILLSRHMVSQADILTAQARKFSTQTVDLKQFPYDPELTDMIGLRRCLAHSAVAVKRIGAGVLIATSRPDEFARLTEFLPPDMRPALMVLASEADIQTRLVSNNTDRLSDMAENRVGCAQSCRDWNLPRLKAISFVLLIALAALAYSFPTWIFPALMGWAIVTLIASTALRFGAMLQKPDPTHQTNDISIIKRPVVSIMVPLLHERAIAAHLIKRLSALKYPRELLDVCLVVEADDHVTKETLSHTHLPSWMRTIVVPNGTLKTKPRAMNYALDFCKGSIIGVYDAEDAPAPDQIENVVTRFAQLPADIVCLQGVLDFYNSHQNWLSRCFTIEYATWFRVILPGLQKMGLAVPLGGTTLFFRRAALEDLGAWDAHNVTEDADLGMRLARRGYRTDIIKTVTLEEANCRAWPWIKQRSRWLKGYAITYGVHMKSPRKLLQELGVWKFLGFQILFLATLSQFVLAPLLWCLWLIPLNASALFGSALSGPWMWGLVVAFIGAELISVAANILAIKRQGKRSLWLWIPSMHIYFWLGTLAVYKALWEIIRCPFYWDKTSHGDATATLPEQPRHPILDAPEKQLIYVRAGQHTPRPHHRFQWLSQSLHVPAKF